MPHFDGAVLHRVEHLQAWHDFAGGEKLDLEFVVGGLCDGFAHDVGAAINCVQRLRPARGHAPFQPWHGLRNCRRGNRRRTSGPKSRDLDEISTFHDLSHLKPYRQLVSRRPRKNEDGRYTKTRGVHPRKDVSGDRFGEVPRTPTRRGTSHRRPNAPLNTKPPLPLSLRAAKSQSEAKMSRC